MTRIYYICIQRLIWIIVKPFFSLFFCIKVYDPFDMRKRVKAPLIIASSHKGFFDMFFLESSFPLFSGIHPVRFMAETKRLGSPVLQFLVYIRIIPIIYILFGAFPSGKGLGVERAIELPARLLNRRQTIMIFPEGRRIFEDELGEFRQGAAALAIKTGIPILPVSLRIQKLGNKKCIIIHFGKELFFEKDTSYEGATSILRENISQLFFTKHT